MRLQQDRRAIADDEAAGAREVVVKARRVDAAELEAIALADEAFRQPDELHHQRVEEPVELRRGDGHERPVVAHGRVALIAGLVRHLSTPREEKS